MIWKYRNWTKYWDNNFESKKTTFREKLGAVWKNSCSQLYVRPLNNIHTEVRYGILHYMGYISFFSPIVISLFFLVLNVFRISGAKYGWIIIPIILLLSFILSVLVIIFSWRGHILAYLSVVIYGLILIFGFLLYKGYFGPLTKIM